MAQLLAPGGVLSRCDIPFDSCPLGPHLQTLLHTSVTLQGLGELAGGLVAMGGDRKTSNSHPARCWGSPVTAAVGWVAHWPLSALLFASNLGSLTLLPQPQRLGLLYTLWCLSIPMQTLTPLRGTDSTWRQTHTTHTQLTLTGSSAGAFPVLPGSVVSGQLL